jgi:flagellar basal body P-ring formation protein FlgA
MRLLFLMAAIAGLLLSCLPVHAQTQATQSPAGVQRAIEDFVRVQTSGYAGRATFSIGSIDQRLAVPACGALEVFLPVGSRLWGNSSVGVRCGAPTPWTLYVGVTVRVSGSYVVAARALAAGQPLASQDLTLAQGDLTQLAGPLVTDASDVLGKTLSAPLAPGQAIRADTLRVTPAILQGQSVRLVSQGRGFRVTADGKAVANALPGQVAHVRTASGQTVSGIARPDGTVEVTF